MDLINMNEFEKVKESIEAAIKEIEKKSPKLAGHLRNSIKVNEKNKTFCYEPKDE